ELPAKPDVVVTVVPPQVTELVVEECKELGVRKIWMQPGSESEKAVEYCEKNNIAVVHGACIMIERKRRP
ncbi:MAG: CoA-binding protein, partial [Thermosphaera sp.]